ncbi:hypothetical protein TRFO_40962 [Tritrichomonas foetus]|uniref:Uncharacterized protein n=1 Tax=Tritrichomonas foetus TaxID=1144522 RepID=A0A1J4J1Q9_9EUKA|nr:hypothetical protein TRFO_40962 [Tritrichomonas foetus]|eukprot:OHS92705.1 hypothetical protein TRFO_40962 [Tritrichomonas foetus]
MAYSKCLSFSGENVASECVKIALELAEKGKEIDVITTAGDGGLRDIIVEAMKKANEGIEGGIFDGLSEPLEDTS